MTPPLVSTGSSLLLAVALCVAAPRAVAQVPGQNPDPYPCIPFAPDNTIDWPTAPGFGSPPDFRRAVIADLNGDQVPESVVSAGGIAVALWGVVAYDAPELVQFPSAPAPSAIADLATLAGGGGGAKDGVLMTDSRGLFLVKHDGTHFLNPTVVTAGNWVNAAPIHVDDLNVNGEVDVVLGISADRLKVMSYAVTVLMNGVLFAAGPTITVPYPALDVVAMDWDHAPGRELVVLTTKGLRVYTASGTLITTVSHLRNPGCITRFRTGGATPTDYLAWTRGNSFGLSDLLVLGGQGVPNEVSSSIGFPLCDTFSNITPTALVAGDYDGDGDQDLLIAHETNRTAVVLFCQNSGQHFVLTDTLDYDVLQLSAGTEFPGDVGIPAFGQLDPEPMVPTPPANPDDIVFPCSAGAQVLVFTTLSTERDRFVAGQPPTAAVVFHPQTEFEPGTNGPPGQLRLGFRLLERYSACTAADLVIWYQPNPGSVVEHASVSHTRHHLVPGAPVYQWITCDFDLPTGNCWDTNLIAPCFYAELAFVDANGSKSRIFTGGFRLRSCGTPAEQNYAYMIDQGMSYQSIPHFNFPLQAEHGLRGDSVGGELLGVYVPMSSQPPFEDNVPPFQFEWTWGHENPDANGQGQAHPFYVVNPP